MAGHSEEAADLYSRYDNDGFLAPLPALDPDEARALLDKLEAFEQDNGEDASMVLRHKGHIVLPWLADLIRDSRILAPVISLLGPDIRCWTTNVFSKKPGDGKYVPWHQDATYWGLSSNEVVTAWVALTESTPLSGCMRVIPGSHKQALKPHRDTFAENSLLTRGQEIAVDVDRDLAVDLILKPGEMSLHHVLIAHASEPNQSTNRRLGIAIRYIPTHVWQTHDTPDSATLVCGNDAYGYFQEEPRPRTMKNPVARAFYEKALRANQSILYGGSAVKEK